MIIKFNYDYHYTLFDLLKSFKIYLRLYYKYIISKIIIIK